MDCCAELRIENLSYWHSELHGKLISSEDPYLALYPRGKDGDGQYMVIEIIDSKKPSRIELLFVGSDDSVLYKQEIQDPKWTGDSLLTLSTCLNFEGVTRRKNNLDNDVFTLRYYTNKYHRYRPLACITIDAADVFLRIPVSLLLSIKKGERKTIATITHNIVDRNFKLDFDAEAVGRLIINLELWPVIEKALISIISINLSFVNSDFEVTKTVVNKEKKFWNCDKDDYITVSHFLRSEIEENAYFLDFNLKFISGSIVLIELDSGVQCIHNKRTKILEHTVSKDYKKSLQNVPGAVLSNDLLCLYQDQDFSDFVLKCDNVSIPVHKAILSARSPVFKIMLSCDMQEAASGCLDIVDIDPPTLAHFLTFLYTGAVGNEGLQEDSAFKLYYAADKYQVPTLKKDCADFLCDNISLSNVCDVLSLADKHQDQQLTSSAHEFLLDNYNDVLASEEWNKFMENQSLLAVKTVTHFATKKLLTRNKIM